jgi:enamine deaminase RidA (YjgF/YER057c/UK114 family)
MNIAELKGDKTVKALATRLLAKPAKGGAKISQSEMEAELVRLNPELSKIHELPEGTPVVVPSQFGLAPAESKQPLRDLTAGLLDQAEQVLENFRESLAKHARESAAQAERVKTWLASAQSKEALRQSPDLKEVFATTAATLKGLPKTEAAAEKSRGTALDEIQSALAELRAKIAAPETR